MERAQRRGEWMEGKQEGRLGSVHVGLRSHDERFGELQWEATEGFSAGEMFGLNFALRSLGICEE